jgi:hypothetical protein
MPTHASHLTAHTLYPSQSSAAVTHFLLTATNLSTPEGWTVWSTVPAPGIEPGPYDLWRMRARGARPYPFSHADRCKSSNEHISPINVKVPTIYMFSSALNGLSYFIIAMH